jgi:hypothetical protein
MRDNGGGGITMEPIPMQEAVAASLYGPYRSRLKVGGHHFDIRQAYAKRVGSVLHVNGHISHSIENWPNEEVIYEFSIEGNSFKEEPKRKIDQGGFGKLAGVAGEQLAKYYKVPVSSADVEKAAGALYQAAFGDWKPACDAIIASVAFAFMEKELEGGLEKEPTYRVVVKTGDIKDAGTDADVYLTLIGTNGTMSEPRLLDNEQDNFERNKRDVFDIKMKDIGEIDHIVIGHNNEREKPGWFLETVEISREDLGKTWTFRGNRWLSRDEEDGQTYATLRREGDLIRGPDKGAVFLIENGRRRWIPDPATLESRWSWDQVRDLPAEAVNAIPLGEELPSAA